MKRQTKQDRIADYVEKMGACVNDGDLESVHLEADELLCELLVELGYDEVVKAWEKLGKWYA